MSSLLQQDEISFCSRRSPVLSVRGCVASGQPIASQIGVGEYKLSGLKFH